MTLKLCGHGLAVITAFSLALCAEAAAKGTTGTPAPAGTGLTQVQQQVAAIKGGTPTPEHAETLRLLKKLESLNKRVVQLENAGKEKSDPRTAQALLTELNALKLRIKALRRRLDAQGGLRPAPLPGGTPDMTASKPQPATSVPLTGDGSPGMELDAEKRRQAKEEKEARARQEENNRRLRDALRLMEDLMDRQKKIVEEMTQ